MFKTLRGRGHLRVAFVVLCSFPPERRSAVIPLVAVPVAHRRHVRRSWPPSGFSLNNLTLFGLVWPSAIVSTTPSVVVEGSKHHIEHGLAPLEATIQAEPCLVAGHRVGGHHRPCSSPVAFITGLTGQF